MDIQNPAWVSTARDEFTCTVDGNPTRANAIPGLKLYDAILAAGMVIAEPALAAVKAELRAAVDAEAETQRLRYITGGATKAMEYLEARDQAIAIRSLGAAAANALPDHGRAEYPVLAASVPAEAATLWDAHVLILGRYEAYGRIAGQIKSAAVLGKRAISDAADAAGARTAYAAIVWPA